MEYVNSLSCPVCHQERDRLELRDGKLIPESLVGIVRHRRASDWSREQMICDHCLSQAKMEHIQEQFKADKGTLSSLDREVIEDVASNRILSTDAYEVFERTLTRAERGADGVVKVIANWYFPTFILTALLLWIFVNVLARPFEPYPVILLAVISAVLASLAAIQGPVILMSQRRSSKQDRLKAEEDYRVNLKAEFEILYLNEKIDRLFLVQNERLQAIETTQKELLQWVSRKG